MDTLNSFLSAQLTNLGALCGARALALWIPFEDRLDLVADWRLEQPLYNLLRRSWATSAAELGAGRRVTLAADLTLLPLAAGDGSLLGVLQYVGPWPTDGARRVYLEERLARLARVLHPLPAAVVAEGLLELAPFDLEGPTEDVERRTYYTLLERCGWDVTLAAASLDMTRQAFYERIEALGLTRPPKLPQARADHT